MAVSLVDESGAPSQVPSRRCCESPRAERESGDCNTQVRFFFRRSGTERKRLFGSRRLKLSSFMSPVPELLHPGARRRRSALLPKTSGVARSLGILLFAVSLVSSGLGFRLPRPETKASPPKSPSEEPSRAPRTFLRSSESVPRRCFLSVGEAMVLRGAWAGTQRALDLAKTIGVRAFSTQTGRRRPELQSFFFNEMEKPRVVRTCASSRS